VLATPATAAGGLLEQQAPELAAELLAIPYAPMSVVHLGVRREHAGKLPEAFGFLVPRDEGLRILGAIFSSRLFEGRAPAGHELVTVFTGGALDPEAIHLPDETVIDYARRDLQRALGGSWEPALAEVTRWPQAIPQYELGHKDRLARIEHLLAPLQGLELLGNWRGGIAMPNCAREGEDAARRIAAAFVSGGQAAAADRGAAGA
jgi:oxygen-dependent protoporphyrinogen oxidase